MSENPEGDLSENCTEHLPSWVENWGRCEHHPLGSWWESDARQIEHVTTYEVVVPSQPSTGILSVDLHRTNRMKLPEPFEESRDFPKTPRGNPWMLYAIMEYERFQISTESISCSRMSEGRQPIPGRDWSCDGMVSWSRPRSKFSSRQSVKFDASTTSSELAMRMFARRSDTEGGIEIVSLGSLTMNPFTKYWSRRPGFFGGIPVEDGPGYVDIDISYLEKKVPPLHDTEVWRIHGEMGSSDLVYVQKLDTNRSYGMKTVPMPANIAPASELIHRVEHPFIAPLKFAFESANGLSLLSPLASGGPLAHRLQRIRRLPIAQARIYSAELLCALEYLHGKDIVLAHLNMDDIFLDSPGHVSLCNPGLFSLGAKNDNSIVPGKSGYPAPELVRNEAASRASDWWAFGIILHEMLTGLPPFYDRDIDKRRLNICKDPVCPEGLPPIAKDILIKLLRKDKINRLGATNGASEIRDHPFFQGVNWHDLLRQKNSTLFKPHDAMVDFWPGENERDGINRFHKRAEKIVDRRVLTRVVDAPWPYCEWEQQGWLRDENAEDDSDAPLPPTAEDFDDGWELVWDQTSYRFHFQNRVTEETSPGRLSDECSRRYGIRQEPPAVPPPASIPACGAPPLSERKAAFATALVVGYGARVFSQILEYGDYSELRCPITYMYPRRPRKGLRGSMFGIHEVRLTPLEWAVEHNRLDLVKFFLAHGADANGTIDIREGPALLKAVRRRSLKLIEVLVRKTDRVSGTRALLFAVKHRYSAIVNMLLANGVQCDFEESDRPLDKRPYWDTYRDAYELEVLGLGHFAPPLLIAARSGNADIVRALLAHGADPNAPYHGIPGLCRDPEGSGLKVVASFTCGRVIQSAMEYGHSKIVKLLLDAGADIRLPHPDWPELAWAVGGHECEPIPRTIYLEVTAGLER